jgi:hypothetical protein
VPGLLVARLPSSRHPDVAYEVRLEGETYTCNCPGFGFRKRCRHATALESLRALPAERQAAARYSRDTSQLDL